MERNVLIGQILRLFNAIASKKARVFLAKHYLIIANLLLHIYSVPVWLKVLPRAVLHFLLVRW